jgi:hypothetical protein
MSRESSTNDSVCISVELSVPGGLCGPREAEPGDSLPPPRLQGTVP